MKVLKALRRTKSSIKFLEKSGVTTKQINMSQNFGTNKGEMSILILESYVIPILPALMVNTMAALMVITQ